MVSKQVHASKLWAQPSGFRLLPDGTERETTILLPDIGQCIERERLFAL